MSDYSIGDRVRLARSPYGPILHVETAAYFGIHPCGYQMLTLVNPDTGERLPRVLTADVEPVGFRVIEGGPFPRLVTVDGVRVAS